ncbi:TPA: hypothetical protein I8608_000583 [Morganella morganii]|jgi:hypothetical protein|uniref:Uncharacterized protein n=1 Tax=Morganella morganii TaxID=582 RepID=A0AAN5MCL9_MORMO|nr:hypothetical protein [Morganella morganii]HED3890514.1 hypothetical protein [Morganella morganii]
MTLVEKFSIIGSVASAIAIVVSFTFFTIQRQEDIARRNSDRNNELLALKKIILSNCQQLRKIIEENSKILNKIEMKSYAGIEAKQAGETFYINFKDGYTEKPRKYYWKTSLRFYLLRSNLEKEVLVIAKHNVEIIDLILGLNLLIDSANDSIRFMCNKLYLSTIDALIGKANIVKNDFEKVMQTIDLVEGQITLQ